MSHERTKYADSILISKQPYEATETIRIRLSQAKLINKNFYLFFKEVADLKKSYSQQLRKIIAENEDLNKLLNQQMLQNQVLTPEEMQNFKFNSLGELQPLWNTVMEELKTDLNANVEFQHVLQQQVVSALKDSTENNSNWSESKRLHSKLSQIAASIEYYSKNQNDNNNNNKLEDANRQWGAEAPYLFELFETIDFNRLQILKDCLLRYQTGFSDYLLNTTGQCETVMAKLLEFDPELEIDRFAQQAAQYDFTTITDHNEFNKKITQQQQQQQSKARIASNGTNASSPHKEKRKSTFGNLGHRFTSSSTVLHHDLLNNEFSDSTNNPTLKNKKSSHKLRSRMGSIFGKNLLGGNKNRKSQYGENSKSKVAEKENQRPKSNSISTSNSNSNSRIPSSSNVNNNGNNSRRGTFTSTASSENFKKAQQQQQQQQVSNNNRFSTQPPVDNRNDMIREEPRNVSSQPYQSQQPLPENSNGISMAQAPLQPQMKNKPLPNEPSSNPYGLPPVQEQGQAVNEDRPLHIHAPAPPPARKQTISRDSEIPATPAVPAQVAQVMPMQVTGELKELNPQATGSSSMLNGQSLFHHATLENSTFGLNASVAEVINATFKEGVLQDSQLVGEIAFTYIPNSVMNTPLPIGINLKIHNSDKFDKVILNQAFMERVDSEQYKINPEFIDSRSLGAIKYSIKSPLTPPIVVQPVWKFEPHQASVVLTVKMSPMVPAEIKQLVLNDFVVSVSIDGAETTSALSKPQGSFSKEKKRITWRFKEPFVINRDQESDRLIARFITQGVARESKNGVITKFVIRDHIKGVGSDLTLDAQELDVNDPFGGEWTPVNTSTTLTAGNYHGCS